jgi:2,3-dihydroxybenzoate decarboxylase
MPPKHSRTAGATSDLFRAECSNEYLAQKIKDHPKRFAGFCALSMHDPHQASEELKRCVREHGMVGAMLNDFQTGPDGKPIYYDESQFDVFWETVQELDVVVYIHPRFPHPSVIQNLFGGRRGLLGACWYLELKSCR